MELTGYCEKALEYLNNSGWLGFIIYLVIGFVLAALLHRLFRNLLAADKLPPQVVKLAAKALEILLWCFILVQGLRSIGVDVVGVLGAAGVVGVAIGFASQTVLGNLISGVFIISERSLKLGDYISIDGKEGTVESINLLSIHLRQSDNALVRVPCEAFIKSPVTNITGATLRRCDLDLGVAYGSDLEVVREVILDVIAKEDKLCDQPAPVLQFKEFAASSVLLHIGAWCRTEDYHAVRYRFADSLLKAFRAKGLEIPFTTITLTRE